jgi:hypothetical protein
MKEVVMKLSCLVCAVSVAAGVLTSAASADTPVTQSFDYTYSAVMTGYCNFGVDVVTHGTGYRIDFFDGSGTLIRRFIHQLNVDTFSANGKTLTSLPFTFDLQQSFDDAGTVNHSLVSGVIEMIPLPDGSLFVSAGRADFQIGLPGIGGHLLTPYDGHTGDIAALCAALAP